MKKTFVAVAVLGAFAGSAMAADVTLYGRIDTGLAYTHTDVNDVTTNKAEMTTGWSTVPVGALRALKISATVLRLASFSKTVLNLTRVRTLKQAVCSAVNPLCMSLATTVRCMLAV